MDTVPCNSKQLIHWLPQLGSTSSTARINPPIHSCNNRLAVGLYAVNHSCLGSLLEGFVGPPILSKELRWTILFNRVSAVEREREKFINHIQSMKQCKTMTIN